jgi:hypothetical protein
VCRCRHSRAAPPSGGQVAGRVYTGRAMGVWYTIGLLVGLGVAFGILAAGLLPRGLVAAVVAAAAGLGLGVLVFHWAQGVGGGAGGLVGGLAATPIVAGALRRGGTRGGLALLVGLGAVAAAALAFIPAVGYLEAVVLPALALRLRSKTAERFAGLRTLARD